ncbi:TetR family transcriptional regulator [Actinomadura hallensis]|mgnify:FL=1|uniref:TetR family transcriptional regulator n=1 Tax=Actinomadura hallensis TaxID=337895 RepID=A0A543IF40_9ACTN|nr:TetR/AcrR family transcriptional regulator C-terminal domain-containing protein [Actinomadura hallensis]TQM69191.1 TetR family transcriptional regulator [Actinomadura hallensis]HLV71607.1 TetR/AcrR family transcriptional regulator C-terminal domain-containing protein [Vulgatibacteraceae bacterium]
MVRQPSINAQHRTPLSTERIIEAALRIVDGQGLARLTMRRLGDALEVEAMAIYHHLPRGKEQLLDALVTHVASSPAQADGAASAGWREPLRRWAAGYRERLLAHAGVLPLLVTRRNSAALTTTVRSLQEVLRRGGVGEEAAAAAAHTVLGYVIGHAALEVRGTPEDGADRPVDWDSRFTAGLDLVLAGVG